MFLAFKARTRAREQQSLPVAVAVSVLAAALTAAARHPSAWPNSPVAPATLRGLALRPRSTLTARPTAAWPPRRQRAARARTPASTTSAGAWSYLPPGPRARTLRQPRPSTQHVVDRLGKMIGRLPLLCAGEQLLGADQEDEHVSECEGDRSILQRQSHQCPVPLLKRLRAQSSHDSVLWTASFSLRVGHHAIHVQPDLRQCIPALLLAMWACCVAQWPAADEDGPLRDHVRENQRHVRTPIHEHRVPRSTQPQETDQGSGRRVAPRGRVKRMRICAHKKACDFLWFAAGRHITGSDTSWKNIVGPDPRDPCTRVANCTECNGSCGWCRKEVQNKVTLQSQHNGWCSSICVTSVLGPEFRRKHDLRERRS